MSMVRQRNEDRLLSNHQLQSIFISSKTIARVNWVSQHHLVNSYSAV